MNFAYLFAIGGVICGIFLGLLLLTIKKGKRQTHTFLGLFLLSICIQHFETILYETHLLASYPYFMFISNPIILLLGPFGYLFFKSALIPHYKFSWHELSFFIPAFFFLVLSIPMFAMSYADKLKILEDAYKRGYSQELDLATIIMAFHAGLFLFLSIKLLNDYGVFNFNIKLKNHTHRVWLFTILSALIFLYSVWVVEIFFPIKIITIISNFDLPILIFVISFFSLRDILNAKNTQITELSKTQKEIGNIKYEKSILREEDIAKYIPQLKNVFEIEALYKDQNLSQNSLAQKLGVSPQTLSQLLNQHLRVSFNELVNEYRIEAVKKLLRDPAYIKYSIFGIATECGFSSKASFNALFKKNVGVTPSAYRETNLEKILVNN